MKMQKRAILYNIPFCCLRVLFDFQKQKNFELLESSINSVTAFKGTRIQHQCLYL